MLYVKVLDTLQGIHRTYPYRGRAIQNSHITAQAKIMDTRRDKYGIAFLYSPGGSQESKACQIFSTASASCCVVVMSPRYMHMILAGTVNHLI